MHESMIRGRSEKDWEFQLLAEEFHACVHLRDIGENLRQQANGVEGSNVRPHGDLVTGTARNVFAGHGRKLFAGERLEVGEGRDGSGNALRGHGGNGSARKAVSSFGFRVSK